MLRASWSSSMLAAGAGLQLLVMLALLASVNAGCTDTSGQQPFCETKSKTTGTTTKSLQCVVGSSMEYKPVNTKDNRFTGADFRHECLVNPGKSCHSSNNTLQEDDPSLSCCSCYLYANYCAGTTPPPGAIQIKHKSLTYVVSHQPIIDQKNHHALVMPKDPCSGIEWWNNYDQGTQVAGMKCPGEDIWDAAASVIADSTSNPPDGADNQYGMAINPISRRGQHQMHIHIAKVSSSLLAILSYAHNVLKTPTTFNLDCGLKAKLAQGDLPTRLLNCRFYTGTKAPGPEHPKVTIYSGLKSVAEAKPFANTYKGQAGTATQPNPTPPPDTDTIRWTSLLVIEVPPRKINGAATRNWAVITNDVGPAECFFVPNGDDTLSRACQDP